MSDNLIFVSEQIYFAEFKDRKFRDFLEINGAKIVSDVKKSTMIIYEANTGFRKTDTYKIAKKHDITYTNKDTFLETNKIDINDNDDYEFNDDDSDLEDIISTESIESVVNDSDKKICKLIKSQIINFYDNIYIPYDSFVEPKNRSSFLEPISGDIDDNFRIHHILKKNTDVLFYSEKYLTDPDQVFFKTIFDKYIKFIEPIFNPDLQLGIYLETWYNNKSKTYLKQIINDDKYHIINPVYLANLYKKIFTKCCTDKKLFDEEYKRKLNAIITRYKIQRKEFILSYKKIVNMYVYEYPGSYDSIYAKGFINSVLLIALDFVDKLIDLNIYAVHSIITDIVDQYVVLDDIISHNAVKLLII